MTSFSESSSVSLQSRREAWETQIRNHRTLNGLAGRAFSYLSSAIEHCLQKHLISEEEAAEYWKSNTYGNWAKHDFKQEADPLKLSWDKLSTAEQDAALALGLARNAEDWPHLQHWREVKLWEDMSNMDQASWEILGWDQRSWNHWNEGWWAADANNYERQQGCCDARSFFDLEGIHSNDYMVRNSTIKQMSYADNHEESASALLGTILRDDKWWRRRNAVQALMYSMLRPMSAQLEGIQAGVKEVLLHAAMTDPRREVRYNALEALDAFPAEDVFIVIETICVKDDSKYVRELASQMLAKRSQS